MSAPNLTIMVEPQSGGKVVYLPLAPSIAGAAGSGQLSIQLRIGNGEVADVHLNKVTFEFSSPPVVQPKSVTADVAIVAGAEAVWHHGTGDNMLLPSPAPASMTVKAYCDGFADPKTITMSLAAFDSPLSGDGYRFPARVDDLAEGEYWAGRSAAHSPAGNGVQLFGYDMGVVRFDDATGTWSALVNGGSTTVNEDYLVWGKPIVAMADGKVQSWLDGEPTNPTPPDDLSPPGPVEGNHFYVQHGDALVLYAHLQDGTLNPDLTVAGAEVQAGDQLGLAGNSGNSSAPHLHIHAIRGTAPWAGPPWPIPFRSSRAIDMAVLVPPDPHAPWETLDGEGLPSVTAVIDPAVRARFRKVADEVLVDPLSLVLAAHVYVRLTLPRPPLEVLAKRLRVLLAEVSDGERREAVVRLRTVQKEVDAAIKAVEHGPTDG